MMWGAVVLFLFMSPAGDERQLLLIGPGFHTARECREFIGDFGAANPHMLRAATAVYGSCKPRYPA